MTWTWTTESPVLPAGPECSDDAGVFDPESSEGAAAAVPAMPRAARPRAPAMAAAVASFLIAPTVIVVVVLGDAVLVIGVPLRRATACLWLRRDSRAVLNGISMRVRGRTTMGAARRRECCARYW